MVATSLVFAGLVSIINLVFILAGFYFISADIDGVFVGWLFGTIVSIGIVEIITGIAAGV